VFLDINNNGNTLGRLEIELYSRDLPKTCENFRSLCTGDKAFKMHFKNIEFHRIVKGFMIQGGDITHGNGLGGKSIYGNTFADENFKYKHDSAGVLSMANRGPNTNSSQFFITSVPTPWLDGKHVVFGRVTKGLDLVKKMDSYGSPNGTPTARLRIADCG
jgi:peptidylprolyl isomerase